MKEKAEFNKGKATQIESNPISEIEEWNLEFSKQAPPLWDRLPDIELYMDQVVTFLDRQLLLHRRNEQDRIITPSMINNYTKDHVIPRAKSKKYSRDHIALLMIVSALKKVMSMPDLSELLKEFRVNESSQIEEFYEHFREVQSRAAEQTTKIVADKIEKIDGENEMEVLRNLAMQLTVEAQTRCIAAEKILSILENNKIFPR